MGVQNRRLHRLLARSRIRRHRICGLLEQHRVRDLIATSTPSTARAVLRNGSSKPAATSSPRPQSDPTAPYMWAPGTTPCSRSDRYLYALDGASGVKKWEFKTGGYIVSSPAVGSDGTVYVGSWNNTVFAM